MKKSTEHDTGSITIMIVEDHPLMRKGIREIIESEKDMKVCAEADTANRAIGLMAKHDPDIAIVDLSLAGEGGGIDLIKAMTGRGLRTKAIVLTMHGETLYVEQAIHAGARGYIAKSEAPQMIIGAIREVMKGGLFVSSTISGIIIDRLLNEKEEACQSIEGLTGRELEIFELIGKGYKSVDIAKNLNLSINTVETHRKNIRGKLGLASSGDLMRNAIEWVHTNRK
jgi:DNA-binding NarL/FixJ family response regulator